MPLYASSIKPSIALPRTRPRSSLLNWPATRAAMHPSHTAARDTRTLVSLASLVAERRGLLLASLADLSVPALTTEIAAVLWEQAKDSARVVYSMDNKARTKELNRLRASEVVTDRYVAQLVTEWMKKP